MQCKKPREKTESDHCRVNNDLCSNLVAMALTWYPGCRGVLYFLHSQFCTTHATIWKLNYVTEQNVWTLAVLDCRFLSILTTCAFWWKAFRLRFAIKPPFLDRMKIHRFFYTLLCLGAGVALLDPQSEIECFVNLNYSSNKNENLAHRKVERAANIRINSNHVEDFSSHSTLNF